MNSRSVSAVRWLPVCVVALVGVLASVVVTPPSVSGIGPVAGDKLLHAVGYFGFALALVFALAATRASRRTVTLLAFAVPVLFGGVMEVVQLFVATRTAAMGDVLANAAGAGAAVLGWALLSARAIPFGEDRLWVQDGFFRE